MVVSRRELLAILATILVALALPATAAAQPKLLLMHAGAFSGGGPSSESDAVAYGQAHGFATINLDYPLCDPPRAMRYAMNAAVSAAKGRSSVYAYGDSSGAMLAARLAENNKVEAAVGYSPVLDWSGFVRSHPGASTLDCQRGFTDKQLDTVSPGEYPATDPIIDISGTEDQTAPNDLAVAWDQRDPLVTTWQVAGGHLGGGPLTATYHTNMQSGIDWLAAQAGL